MGTIKQFLVYNELNFAKDRLKRLTEINAPKIIIEKQIEMVEDLKNGKFKCGGDRSLLELTFNRFTEKKGRGGKLYIEFDNGVRYFPVAKYGRYICK